MKGWAQTKAGGLTLVLTRRCPVRCGFCPQAFSDQDMTVPVLEAALKAFGKRLGSSGQIKLFGGEPLVRPDLVRRAVLSAKALGLKGGILLSTHGGLLDDAMVRFLRRHPEVEVAFGRPSPKAGRLPKASLNFVLEPGQKAEKVLSRVRDALALGYRSFNFLPVYFIAWKRGELAELGRSFAGLARLLGGLSKAGIPLEVKNLRRRGRVPLYNDGLCVDTDGSVYSSNLVLASGMEAHAGALRLGHVSEPRRLAPPLSDAALRSALRQGFSASALKGTEAADARLTEFVHDLR
ncbi:MAG: radical SAM protein [Elusimicrobia bacterium]|nr:radical SAM protein [Elusimicrobiota bacterium]